MSARDAVFEIHVFVIVALVEWPSASVARHTKSPPGVLVRVPVPSVVLVRIPSHDHVGAQT